MRIHNLYESEDGESHFRDIEIEWTESLPSAVMSDRFPASGLIFRRTEGSFDRGWHRAPRRQYIVNLDGSVKVTASDGECRIIGPGEVLLVEDTTGKGHLSQAVGGAPRHALFIPIEQT